MISFFCCGAGTTGTSEREFCLPKTWLTQALADSLCWVTLSLLDSSGLLLFSTIFSFVSFKLWLLLLVLPDA